MEEKKVILASSFIDYKNEIHKFVIVGITENLGNENNPVVIYSDIYDTKCFGNVKKGLKIGVAICNPLDKFNLEEGIKLATTRAKASDFVLYSTNKGQMNNVLVKAFLDQEINYIKRNPNKYIPGYTNSKIKFLKSKELKTKIDALNKKEHEILDWLVNNPNNADKIIKCLKDIG